MFFAVIDSQDIQKFTETQATDPKLKKETERERQSHITNANINTYCTRIRYKDRNRIRGGKVVKETRWQNIDKQLRRQHTHCLVDVQVDTVQAHAYSVEAYMQMCVCSKHQVYKKTRILI